MATNPMQRKARNSFLGGMLITLIITGAIIAFLIIQLMDIKKKEDAEKSASRSVYVLSKDVSSGQVITTDMLVMQTMNKSLIPSNATGDLSLIENYSLQDKEGNSVYTKTDKNGNASLYIKNNNTEYALLKDENTSNYYIEKNNNEKTFIELDSVPLVAKVDLKANSIITTDLVGKSDNIVTDDVRKQEYNMLILPTDLQTGDYVDVRLMMPSGQDYIVVAKKEVEIPVIGSVDSEDTVWMNLGEDEILSLSSAIVDAFRVKGSKLYVTKYTEAGMQQAATTTYIANAETLELINKDPNIVEKARTELTNRYNKMDYRNIRNNYLNKEVEAAGEDAKANLETEMEESITNTKENRKKYLDAISGSTVE
jgi:hypothetical protein